MAEIAKEGFLLKQQLIHEAKMGLEDKKVWMTKQPVVLLQYASETWILSHNHFDVEMPVPNKIHLQIFTSVTS